MEASHPPMFYEPRLGHGLPHDPFKATVAPRPIGWISSRDAGGRERDVTRSVTYSAEPAEAASVDASGLVNAPYAVPSESLRISSVRDRQYRGYCAHNAQALAAAAEFRAKQSQIVGVLSTIPGLDERRRAGAAAYLDTFFRDIATDETLTRRVLRTCIN